MTRKDFIKLVADETGYTQKATKEFLEALQDIVYREMKNGNEIKIFDSITLYAKDTAEKIGRNPKTGETIVLPQHLSPKAKFGTGIRRYLKEC